MEGCLLLPYHPCQQHGAYFFEGKPQHLVRMLLVSFFFRSTFSDKAFHICLLCFMGLFADQASCLAEHLYSAQGRHPLEDWLYQACSFTDYALFCNITNSIRSTLFYLGFEYIVMCLFLFSLKDISRLSEKAYGLLVAVTAAALLVSTYFLGRILMLDAGMLPFRYQAQFYLIRLQEGPSLKICNWRNSFISGKRTKRATRRFCSLQRACRSGSMITRTI